MWLVASGFWIWAALLLFVLFVKLVVRFEIEALRISLRSALPVSLLYLQPLLYVQIELMAAHGLHHTSLLSDRALITLVKLDAGLEHELEALMQVR